MSLASDRSAADRPAMIEVEQLTKCFGPTRAVDGISFQVPKGEILGFLGPNGAGKTTTMRILTGYTPATSGHARIGGFETVRQSMQTRRMIGYLPESAPIYLNMKVRPYLDFMAQVKGHPRSRRRPLVEEAIEECGLEEVARRVIRNLSKGYRQRVGLAQALLGNPEVLILDEPTVGLDPRQIHEIRQLIRGMAGRRTVLLSTHILPEVSMTCQSVIIIHHGRIMAEGTPESLVSRIQDRRTVIAHVEGAEAAVLELLRKVEGVADARIERSLGAEARVYRIEIAGAEDPRGRISAAITGAGHGLLELQSTGMSLEDIFLRVISSQDEVA